MLNPTQQNREPYTFDVFLSHSAEDKEAVRSLASRLKEDGLRVWFDEWQISAGDDVFLSIEEGLQRSRALVLLISPRVFDSEWLGLERSTVLFRDPRNVERRFIPVLLETSRVPDSLARYSYIDYRDRSESAYQQILSSLRSISPTGVGAEVSSRVPSTHSKLYSMLVARLRDASLRFETIARISEDRFHLIIDCSYMFRVSDLTIHILSLGINQRTGEGDIGAAPDLRISEIPDSSLTILLSTKPKTPTYFLSPCVVASPERFMGFDLHGNSFKAFLLDKFLPRHFNPYQSTRAVERRMFFGRHDEIVEILRSGNMAVVGPRRVGKSSLALHLRHHLRTYGWKHIGASGTGGRVAVSYVDAGSLVGPEDLWSAVISDMPLEERDLSRGMLRKVVRGTKDVVGRSDYEILRHLVQQKYRKLVLILDEADVLISRDYRNGWKTFSQLRALFDELAGEGKLILFGFYSLYRALADQDFPLFGRIGVRRLQALSAVDVNALVETPIRELGVTLLDAPRLLYEVHLLTGGLPNLVQEVCRTIVNDIGTPQATLTAAGAMQTIERRVDELSYRVARIIRELPDDLPKFIALSLADESVLRVDEVLERLEVEHKLTVPRFSVKEALESLYLTNIVRPGGEEGVYVPVSELVRRVLLAQGSELRGGGLLEVFAWELRERIAPRRQ